MEIWLANFEIYFAKERNSFEAHGVLSLFDNDGLEYPDPGMM